MYEIKKLPLDKNKRHFVVGDIHGRMDGFEKLLESVNYDPENDIIYSVGDMIDRGDRSCEVVDFFKRPNAHAIMGNHEYMVIDSEWYACWLQNGGMETLQSLGDRKASVRWLENFILDLPLVMDVGEDGDEDAFRLVHAELPLEWDEQRLMLQLGHAAEAGNDDGVESLIWARTAIGHALDNIEAMRPASWDIPLAEGRSGRNIFCGHTPVNKVVKLHDMTFIDTWKSKTLTMVNALTKEVHTVKVPYKNLKMG